MTTPFPFVSGAVLSAANLNSITELPTRTLTGSGAAVAADSYSRVILDGTSITYTINTSTFTAGQVIEVYNANSTAATIAAGAGVTLNGASGFTLAQYQTGQLYAVSATSFVLSKSDVTVSAGGLVYITGAAFTTATSFSLPNDTFSSTYRNYKMIASITAVTGACTITGRIRSGGADVTDAKYYQMSVGLTEGAGGSNQGQSGATSFALGNGGNANYPNWTLSVDILQPQVSTVFNPISGSFQFFNETNYIGRAFNATYNNGTTATSYDSFSVISSVASSITGVYRVYGYADS